MTLNAEDQALVRDMVDRYRAASPETQRGLREINERALRDDRLRRARLMHAVAVIDRAIELREALDAHDDITDAINAFIDAESAP